MADWTPRKARDLIDDYMENISDAMARQLGLLEGTKSSWWT